MEMSGQLHASAALPPGKEPLVPIGGRLGGHQSRYGRSGKEKNFQPLPGLEPTIIQAVAQRYTTGYPMSIWANICLKFTGSLQSSIVNTHLKNL
jgi:hypothetical protein